VLWFYYEGNDLFDLRGESTNPILIQYLKEKFSQGIVNRQDELDRAIIADFPRQKALAAETWARRRAHQPDPFGPVMGFMKLANLRQRLGLVEGVGGDEIQTISDFEGQTMDLFRQVLSQAQARVTGWGGKLYFVYLTDFASYANYPDIGHKLRPRVLEVVSSLGIPLIDIDPVFRAQSDPLSLFPFREPGHYTEPGHRLVSEKVLRIISSKPPNS